MKNSLHQHAQIALHLCLYAGAIILGTIVANLQQATVETALLTRIGEQETTLLSLSTVIDNNSSGEDLNSILVDCPLRTEYERMLADLDTLSQRELVTLQGMYQSCGTFYPTQKAIMVSKLRLTYEEYLKNIALYDKVADSAGIFAAAQVFEDILLFEEERATNLKEESEIQAALIAAYLSGKTNRSQEVQALKTRRDDVTLLLTQIDQNIDQLREGIEK